MNELIFNGVNAYDTCLKKLSLAFNKLDQNTRDKCFNDQPQVLINAFNVVMQYTLVKQMCQDDIIDPKEMDYILALSKGKFSIFEYISAKEGKEFSKEDYLTKDSSYMSTLLTIVKKDVDGIFEIAKECYRDGKGYDTYQMIASELEMVFDQFSRIDGAYSLREVNLGIDTIKRLFFQIEN